MLAVEIPDLSLHYDELGSSSGDAVLLLHGWPDHASTWDDVARSANC